MATTDPPKIRRLATRLETVVDKRRVHKAAVDRLTAEYDTRFDQWGHFLDQKFAVPFGSHQYIAFRQEASKALQDVCELNQQREQEQAHINRLRSREQTLRRKLVKARAKDDLQKLKKRCGDSEG